jgi:hypothetical protein
MFDNIVFPRYEGLPFRPFPPTPDGYVEPEKMERALQTGTPASVLDIQHPEFEVGYTHSARVSYEDGGGSGMSPASFQGVWDPANHLLYLGCIVRLDPAFDQEDRLILVFSVGGVTRRIDIRPNENDFGARGNDDPPMSAFSSPTIHVRNGRDPFVVPAKVYQPNPAAPTPKWVETAAPDNLKYKVRSVFEEGPGNRYWSIEVVLPTLKGGPTPGGNNWMDLEAGFEFYLNLVRIGPSKPVPIVDLFSIQATWPFDPATPERFVIKDPTTGPLTPENWDIPKPPLSAGDGPQFGTASLLAPGAQNPAKGVMFQNGINGIGVLGTGGTIGKTLDMTKPFKVNTMVARVVNTETGGPTPQIQAEFRLSRFGLAPGRPDEWSKPPSDPTDHTPNPSAQKPVPPGGASADLTFQWQITQDDVDRYGNHQCMIATLVPNGPANLVESSMRGNLNIVHASRYDDEYLVSGRGYPTPPGGGSHEFLLHTAKVPVDLTATDPEPEPPGPEEPGREGGGGEGGWAGEGGEGPIGMMRAVAGPAEAAAAAGPQGPRGRPVITWLLITNAYRAIGKRLTVGGMNTRVHVHAGSFGHFVVHELEWLETPQNVDLTSHFSGAGIKVGANGLSSISVPDGTDVFISGSLRAAHKSWWMRWLIWLLSLIRRLLSGSS